MGFCDSSSSTSGAPIWADPLGPTSVGRGGKAQYGASGAPQIRGDLFNYMQGMAPQMQAAGQGAANAATAGASNPFWGNAQGYASNVLAGNYLSGSPQLDRAMAGNLEGAQAGAADENARLKSDMAKGGMGYSTGYNQGAQANMAAATAGAQRQNNQVYAQNYMNERGMQNQSPAVMNAATSTPMNYLNSVTNSLMQPANAQGSLLSALSTGGQVITPNQSTSNNPSLGADILNGFSGVVGSL